MSPDTISRVHDYLVNECNVAAATADLLCGRITKKDGKDYFRIGLDELVPPQGGDSRFYPVAKKFVIPVSEVAEPISLTTRFETKAGVHQDSNSMAHPGQYIVINDPSPVVAQELLDVFNATHNNPRHSIESTLVCARANGLTNIYPAPADVMDSYIPLNDTQNPGKPGMYRIKYPRAVSQLIGPVMLDQTVQWGKDTQGKNNLQTQPETVFIFELDKEDKPIYLKDNKLPKARLYDITPFTNEYVDRQRQKIKPESIPLVTLRGELAGHEEDIRKCVLKLAELNALKSQFIAERASEMGQTAP